MKGLLAAALLPIGGFESPGWFVLAIPLVALAWLAARTRPEPTLAWPAIEEARAAGGRGVDPVGVLSGALRAAAALALVAALAGPLGPERELRTHHDGLDLLLVVDTSGSMRALDAEVDGVWRTRLDLAREVVSRFALHRVAEGDRVGLVAFGDTAFTQCPLTDDGTLLEAALARVEAGMAGESTALGDALALAVKRVSAGGSEPATERRGPAAGRLVVLLTDGRANAGSVPVEVAMALAGSRATRVHTVGIGSEGEVAMAGRRGGVERRTERHDLDEVTLRQIAHASRGSYFAARSSEDLAAVYDEIDRLERVPREAPPRVAGEVRPEPFLAAAGGLLLLELAVARVLWRRIP